jgi:hypothetical protein
MDEKLSPEVIRPLLESGERLLWSGRPREGIYWRWSTTLVVLLSLFWLLILAAVALEAESTGVVIFALLFALRPLFALSRPFMEATQRRDLVYGLTDQRVIVASTKDGKARQRLALSDLFRVDVDERTDGTGEVTFSMPRETVLGRSARRTENVVFHLQDDVAQIGALAERARAAAQLVRTG